MSVGGEGSPFADPWAPLLDDGEAPALPTTARPRPRRRLRAPALVGSGVIALAAILGIALSSASGGSGSADARIAAAINLHAADLPGFTVEPDSHATASGQPQAQFNGCIGAHVASYTAADALVPRTFASPTFSDGAGFQSEEVSSSVEITPSSSYAAHDITAAKNALAGAHLRDCFDQAFDGFGFNYPDGEHIGVSDVQLTPIATDVPGAPASFAERLALTITGSAASATLYGDFYGVVVGRDELELTTFGVEQPVPQSTEQQLVDLLVARARSEPH